MSGSAVVNRGDVGGLVGVPHSNLVHASSVDVVTTCVASYTEVLPVNLSRPPVVTVLVRKTSRITVDVDIKATVVVRNVSRGSTCSATVVGNDDVVPITRRERLVVSCAAYVVIIGAVGESKVSRGRCADF